MHGYFQISFGILGMLPNSALDNLYFTALEIVPVKLCGYRIDLAPKNEKPKSRIKSSNVTGIFFLSNLPSESLNKHTGWCERK